MDDQTKPPVAPWRTMMRLLPFVRPHWIWMGLTVLHYAVERVSQQVLAPFLLQQMTDAVTHEGLQGLGRWFLAGVGMLILDAGFALVGRRALAHYTGYTIRDLRNQVTAHVQQLPMGFLESSHSGDLVSRLSADVGSIEGWLPLVQDLVIQPLVFVIGVAYMLTISWKLLLASSILIPVSAILYNRVSKPMEPIAREQAEGLGRINAALQDMLSGIVAVKAFNLQTLLGTRFRILTKDVEKQALRLDWRRSVFIAVYLALRYIPQLVVPLYGGYLTFRGEITPGQLMAANLVIWLVFLPIEQLLNALGRTRETAPAVERVLALLDAPPEPTGSGRFAPVADTPPIHFREVDFAYADQETLLENISFEILPAETVALVGASGCGKSTLLKLLSGFYAPRDGVIDVCGNNLAGVDLTAVREQMALMAQETYLFPMTIAENIAFGRPDATEDEIMAAAQAANAHEFILAQPDGYQTQVGERGARLSGGERQRIALARAILKDAPILLLDEPTSSLDTQSEALIQDALERFMADRTVLIVAHQLSTLQHADRVLVLGSDEEGGPSTICETGTHADLMAQDSLYRQLYLKQTAEPAAASGGLQ